MKNKTINPLLGLLMALSACQPTQATKTPSPASEKTVQQETPKIEPPNDDNVKEAHLFSQNADGTVLDLTTGSLWLGADHGLMSFDEAKKVCAEEKSGGKTGWRLPTLYELRNLYFSASGEPNFPECSKGQSNAQKILHPKEIYFSCYSYWGTYDGDAISFFLESDRFQLKPDPFYKHGAICIHDR